MKDIYEIRIRIHDESDLYNSLDPDQEMISDDVASYIERKYSERRHGEGEPVIHIISDVPVDRERVIKNFHGYLNDEQDILTKEQHRAAFKQVWMFSIGIIFIAIWLYVAMTTENIVVEVLSTIGSFSMWEAADIWIVEAPEMRIKKRRYEALKATEIRFTVSISHNASTSF